MKGSEITADRIHEQTRTERQQRESRETFPVVEGSCDIPHDVYSTGPGYSSYRAHVCGVVFCAVHLTPHMQECEG